LDLAVQDFHAVQSGLPIKSPLSPMNVNFLPHKTAHRGPASGEQSTPGMPGKNRAIRHAAPVHREESAESHRAARARKGQPAWLLWACGGGAVSLAVIAFMFLGGKSNGGEKAIAQEKPAERAPAPAKPDSPKSPPPAPAPPGPVPAPVAPTAPLPPAPAPTLQPVANKPSSNSGWKPLFDGKSINVIRSASFDAWKVVDGAIVNIPGKFNAAQTVQEFTDGMLRIRFSVEDAKILLFNVRQGVGGFLSVLDHNALNSYSDGGKDFELIFKMHGDNVTATLNGKDLKLQKKGDQKRGCLQFNCDGKLMKITALEFKESVSDEF
jgi:hypothetical protein